MKDKVQYSAYLHLQKKQNSKVFDIFLVYRKHYAMM